MFRKFSSMMMVATLATGCTVAKSADETEKEALERRVAELEQKLAESAQPTRIAPQPEAPPLAVAPVRTRPVEAPAPRAEAPVAAPVSVVERAPPATPAPVRPTPPPAPPIVVLAGTTLELTLENALSSKTSAIGDRVVARIESATDDDGAVVLPGGSFLEGRVSDVRESGRVKGKASVDVVFDQIVVRGKRYDIATGGPHFEAGDSHKRDAAIVAGSAVAGAILGKVTGGSGKKGAVIGGAAGGGAVLATKGKEIELPAGSRASVRVTQERVLR